MPNQQVISYISSDKKHKSIINKVYNVILLTLSSIKILKYIFLTKKEVYNMNTYYS